MALQWSWPLLPLMVANLLNWNAPHSRVSSGGGSAALGDKVFFAGARLLLCIFYGMKHGFTVFIRYISHTRIVIHRSYIFEDVWPCQRQVGKVKLVPAEPISDVLLCYQARHALESIEYRNHCSHHGFAFMRIVFYSIAESIAQHAHLARKGFNLLEVRTAQPHLRDLGFPQASGHQGTKARCCIVIFFLSAPVKVDLALFIGKILGLRIFGEVYVGVVAPLPFPSFQTFPRQFYDQVILNLQPGVWNPQLRFTQDINGAEVGLKAPDQLSRDPVAFELGNNAVVDDGGCLDHRIRYVIPRVVFVLLLPVSFIDACYPACEQAFDVGAECAVLEFSNRALNSHRLVALRSRLQAEKADSSGI